MATIGGYCTVCGGSDLRPLDTGLERSSNETLLRDGPGTTHQ
jgi:hypothetical protein